MSERDKGEREVERGSEEEGGGGEARDKGRSELREERVER